MDFLNRTKKHLGRGSNREFGKLIKEEKKKKYLFSEDQNEKYRSSRAGFFMRKRREIAPYTNIFGERISNIKAKLGKSYALTYIGITLLTLSAYIIFLSPYFHISPSHVLLESDNEGIDINIAYRSIEDIYGQSIFFMDEEKVALKLKESLKNISHISIDKLYPNGLKILMSSTPITYDAKILGFEREWKMSENGVLIPKTSKSASGTIQGKKFEIISEALKGEVFLDYKQVIPDEKMILINKIVEIFSLEWKNAVITKIRYFARENELHLTLSSNTVVIITLESEGNLGDYNKRIESTKNQLLGLKTYINKYNNALIDGTITYIDARIIKKLFICKEKTICTENLIRIYGETYKN